MGSRVGARDAAGDLRHGDAIGEGGERYGLGVRLLHVEPIPADRAPVEPGRRASLEPPERQSERIEPRGERGSWRLAHAPGGDRPLAHVDDAAQERAGGEHNGTGGKLAPVRQPHTFGARVAQKARDLTFEDPKGSAAPSRPAWPRGRAVGRPACADPRTAGPLRRFNIRNWMPERSATRPIKPSNASTSRTRCPLPSPPIAGLQDMAPIVSNRCVTSAVRAPRRAEAPAASTPAWPPPTTTTSYLSRSFMRAS